MTSRKRRVALQAYMLDCRDALRLQGWDLEVTDDPPVTDTILAISPNSLRHLGNVTVGTFFEPDKSAEEQRYAVAHELLHLVQADLWDFATTDPGKGWRAALSLLHGETIEFVVQRELERHADFIGRMVAPLLPLPPKWPK